ncbi:hypothetical protein FB451DRAFT_628605 [Mycena latifolia]|nr:hypothetical protein FB451DRAFT_628605 [Mycena latifolia]
MSDNSLPDEIISEILSPALKVREEVFSDTSRVSPFAQYSESSSAYLLVCKSWLRVATPLLYNVVILRSKAQAKALGQALTDNKGLGQFIRKLRVEGAYGAPMGIILKSSPNISDLFLSFEIYATDNTNGLCMGLPFINPTRVILRELEHKPAGNKMTLNLEDALTKVISKWDRLTIIDLPYKSHRRPQRADKIVQALVKSRRLQTVVVHADGVHWAYSALKDCPLQSIQIKTAVLKFTLARLRLDENPKLKALVKYTEHRPTAKALAQYSLPASGSDIAPSLNPSFIPMNAASEEVQNKIWKRILYFAMSVPQLAQDPVTKKLPPRLSLLLVSKTLNRLALPHLYTHIRLKSPAHVSNVSNVLQNNPSLGAVVHTICGEINTVDDSSDSDSGDVSVDSDSGEISEARNRADEAESALALLSQMTALVRFCGSSLIDSPDITSFLLDLESPISWAAFEAMTTYSGSTLREFSKRVAARQRVSPAVFSNLTQLRTLDWKCDTSFDLSRGIPNDAFSNLEEIRIWSADSSFLTVLSRMKLPALRRLQLSTDDTDANAFFKTHGRKLTEIRMRYRTANYLQINIFELCPNLTSVMFVFDPFSATQDSAPQPETFSSPHTVHCLVEKIMFTLRVWSRDKNRVPKWEAFFAGFEPKHFPNLREIEFPSFEWPTTERDIAKSFWVRWAENLLKHNINFTDKNGTKWRPRLKVR